jgi:hypothetical protein
LIFMETFLNNLSHKIIGESIYVHKQLGPDTI